MKTSLCARLRDVLCVFLSLLRNESQITSFTIVYSTVYSCTDQRKHQSSASLAFVRGIHQWTVNSPHKWPVTRKMFPFDDVIMWAHKQFATLCHTLLFIPTHQHSTSHELLRIADCAFVCQFAPASKARKCVNTAHKYVKKMIIEPKKKHSENANLHRA